MAASNASSPTLGLGPRRAEAKLARRRPPAAGARHKRRSAAGPRSGRPGPRHSGGRWSGTSPRPSPRPPAAKGPGRPILARSSSTSMLSSPMRCIAAASSPLAGSPSVISDHVGAPILSSFRGSMAGLCAPLPTLRHKPSRIASHGSRTMRFATPSSWRTFPSTLSSTLISAAPMSRIKVQHPPSHASACNLKLSDILRRKARRRSPPISPTWNRPSAPRVMKCLDRCLLRRTVQCAHGRGPPTGVAPLAGAAEIGTRRAFPRGAVGRGPLPHSGRGDHRLRDLHARRGWLGDELEPRRRAVQGLQRRRDHWTALLPLLHRRGQGHRSPRNRAADGAGGGPVRAGGLAGAEGWHSLLGARGHRSDPRL